MSYIMDLRKIVGHRPLLQVGASVIVVDENNRILLQLRSDNNTWGYAGGSVDLDENVEDAAKRELYEETGLIAEDLILLGVFSGKHMHNTYPNGDEVSNVDMFNSVNAEHPLNIFFIVVARLVEKPDKSNLVIALQFINIAV